jgi:adenylate cyclase
MSSNMQPIEVVELLNNLFSRFDDLVETYGLNKVKTIGDCYMVTSIPGAGDPGPLCAAVCSFGLDMIQALHDYNAEHSNKPLGLRVGVHSGPVVAGVVGTKRFLYDIWGDAVRLENMKTGDRFSGPFLPYPFLISIRSFSSALHLKIKGQLGFKNGEHWS